MIKKVLYLLFLLFGTFYATDGAFKLMTIPSDVTFIGGVLLLGLVVTLWVKLVVSAVQKKDKNENDSNS